MSLITPPVLCMGRMMPLLLFIYLTFVALALLQSTVMLIGAWEHRRYAKGRFKRPIPLAGPWPKVTIIAPCKGLDLDWESNVGALFQQKYPVYEIVFVVQSTADPAYPALLKLIRQYPEISAKIVVAGLAQTCVQKAHNLIVAVDEIAPDTEVLAFVDSDARPHSGWLIRLTHRLRKRGVGAVTGYRCFIPERNTLANHLLVCLNSTVSGLLGPHRFNLIWGGSWAITRPLFEQAGIQTQWHKALSDDLAATHCIQRLGLAVAFEPHCWIPATVDMNWKEFWTFARRQYILVRFHTALQWALATGGCLLKTLALWSGALLVLGVTLNILPLPLWPILLTFALQYLALAGRAYLRHDTIIHFFPSHRDRLLPAMVTDICAAPLTTLVESMVLVASGFGNSLEWRGIRYKFTRDGSIRVHHASKGAPTPPHAHTRRPLPAAGSSELSQKAEINPSLDTQQTYYNPDPSYNQMDI